MSLKFLQIGLGSMGKRRIRNLLANGISRSDIFGFDPAETRGKEVIEKYQVKTFADFKSAEEEVKPDVYIISTPPEKQAEYMLHAAKNKKHFFVEVNPDDSFYDKLNKLLDDTFIAAPSGTFRHFSSIKEIKKLLGQGIIGQVYSFQYYLGQYLPDWHPWEDYRQVYFAQKRTGGCREMFPFELIWLTDVFKSKVKKIGGLTEKLSELDMTADDTYAAVMEFDNKIIGTVTVDLLSRTPLRMLRVIGSGGVLEWNWLEYQLRIFKTADRSWQVIDLPKGEVAEGYTSSEDMYIDEIKSFIQAIKGEAKYPYTFADNQQILKTLQALEKSAKTNKFVSL